MAAIIGASTRGPYQGLWPLRLLTHVSSRSAASSPTASPHGTEAIKTPRRHPPPPLPEKSRIPSRPFRSHPPRPPDQSSELLLPLIRSNSAGSTSPIISSPVRAPEAAVARALELRCGSSFLSPVDCAAAAWDIGYSGFGWASFLAASPVSCSGKDFVSSPLLFLAGFGLVGSLDVRYNFHLFFLFPAIFLVCYSSSEFFVSFPYGHIC